MLETSIPTTTRRALLIGLLGSIVIFCLLLISDWGIRVWGTGSALNRISSDPTDSSWVFLGTVITVGIPVTLFLRLGLLVPIVLTAAILVIGGSLGGGGIFFAVFFWPVPFIAFLTLGGAEYVLRRRSILLSQ